MAESAPPLPIWQRYIVVDDDHINNFVSKLIIQKYSKEAEVQLYTDPETALDRICQLSSNEDDAHQTIILLDINMPRMTGWDFLDEFRNLQINTRNQFRIYMISSSIDPVDKQKAMDHVLLSGFFSKPLNPDHIRTMLAHQ